LIWSSLAVTETPAAGTAGAERVAAAFFCGRLSGVCRVAMILQPETMTINGSRTSEFGMAFQSSQPNNAIGVLFRLSLPQTASLPFRANPA
jgi:hypothetical protein